MPLSKNSQNTKWHTFHRLRLKSLIYKRINKSWEKVGKGHKLPVQTKKSKKSLLDIQKETNHFQTYKKMSNNI